MALFGPSKTELNARINTLEDKVDAAQRKAADAEHEALRARDTARAAEEQAKEYAQAAAEIAYTLSDLADGDDLPNVEDLQGTVITLDEPHVAYKATQNYLVKLLLPEDTTVVHPHHDAFGSNKKRCDQAIVIGFHEVNSRSVQERVPNTSSFDSKYKTVEKKFADEAPALDTDDRSRHDPAFEYELGERVTPDNGLDMDTHHACEGGIHFFCTVDEATDWY